MALATGFVMGWSNMGHVSESDNPANLLYFGVRVVGGVGAWLARALFAMAAVLAVLSVILSSAAPVEIETRVAIGHGVFVALFAVSGLLFRRASLAGSTKGKRVQDGIEAGKIRVMATKRLPRLHSIAPFFYR